MSLESSRFIGNSSSPNLLETFNSRNFHDHMNQSTISKKENLFRTEAVNFLKTSVRFLLNLVEQSYQRLTERIPPAKEIRKVVGGFQENKVAQTVSRRFAQNIKIQAKIVRPTQGQIRPVPEIAAKEITPDRIGSRDEEIDGQKKKIVKR